MRTGNLLNWLLKPSRLGPMGPLELLILQPTPFCNLDCDYCYLPTRSSTKRMSGDVLEAAIAKVFSSGLVDKGFTLAWHAGEPLVVGIEYYRDAFARIARQTPPGITVTHSFQTNATLLTDAWCEFIKQHDLKIGVSVDGPPAIHDAHRKTRDGRGTHLKVQAGMDRLRRHGIRFSTISVLTRDSLDHADEIYRYLVGNGVRDIAFNIEEKEGAHQSSSLEHEGVEDRVRRFMSRIYELNREPHDGDPITVRELARLEGAILGWSPLHDKVMRYYGTQETSPFKIISVDWDGNFSTYSPEMLGMAIPPFGSLHFGNVLTQTFADAIGSAKFQQVARSIQSGVDRCERTCEYFSMCGGGQPGNKAFENGTFDSTTTMRCRLHVQAIADVVLDKLETRAAGETITAAVARN